MRKRARMLREAISSMLLVICTVVIAGAGIAAQEPQKLRNLEALVVKKSEPVWPTEKGMRVRGSAVVEVKLDRRGQITSVSALTGHPLLRQPAIDSVRHWKFRPYAKHGRAQEVAGTVTVKIH